MHIKGDASVTGGLTEEGERGMGSREGRRIALLD